MQCCPQVRQASRGARVPHVQLSLRSPRVHTWIIFCSFWLSVLSSGRSNGYAPTSMTYSITPHDHTSAVCTCAGRRSATQAGAARQVRMRGHREASRRQGRCAAQAASPWGTSRRGLAATPARRAHLAVVRLALGGEDDLGRKVGRRAHARPGRRLELFVLRAAQRGGRGRAWAKGRGGKGKGAGTRPPAQGSGGQRVRWRACRQGRAWL